MCVASLIKQDTCMIIRNKIMSVLVLKDSLECMHSHLHVNCFSVCCISVNKHFRLPSNYMKKLHLNDSCFLVISLGDVVQSIW